MSHNIVSGTLNSAVADSGTFTTGYPANMDSGTFIGGVGHKLTINQVTITSPEKFTLSFGTSTITVTNRTGASLAAGSAFLLELNSAGVKPVGGFDNGLMPPVGCTELIPTLVNLGAPDTAVSNGICASQSVTFATTPFALLNGSIGTTLDNPRNVVGAWTGAAVLTVKGKDVNGNALTESSASGTSFTGKKAFKTITSVAFSANVTGATVGTGVVIGLPIFLQSVGQVMGEFQDGAFLSRGAGTRSLSGTLANISAAASSIYLTSPVAGRVKAVYIAISKAISVANGTITISTAAGTVGTISIPTSGSADGNVYKLDTGLNNTAIAAGAAITVTSDGASTTTSVGSVTVEIETGSVYVAGDQTAGGPTATTGDIRGTYTPNATPDGVKGFAIWLMLSNPKYLGTAQYSS